MSTQQTLLRVQTNIPSGIEYTGNTSMSVTYSNNVTYGGSGTESSPITGTTTGQTWGVEMSVTGGSGTFYYTLNLVPYSGSNPDFYTVYKTSFNVTNPLKGENTMYGFDEYNSTIQGNFKVNNGDNIFINGGIFVPTGGTFNFYIIPDSTTLSTEVLTYDYLDLYSDIPIKLNKSFAELQDIGKRNSDYSVGLSLPGSKKNNAFFENFYNVDTNSLYFDVTRRVNIDVLLDDEKYFTGYMRLNKVSVQNSKVEYDVTLYSNVADLYGKMGNNLLKDLDYNDIDWHFNHYFNIYNVMSSWAYNSLQRNRVVPSLWMYPIVHNGYEYSGDTVNLSGATSGSTRLYTTTLASGYTSYANFTSAGGQEYRINSPKYPILDNQLKPALNMYALIQLMFKNYGYTIKSDFFNTPWFKLLYMYGFYSYDGTKFGYKTPVPQTLGLEGVQVLLVESIVSQGPIEACSTFYYETTRKYDIYVVKKGTGIPCFCSDQINISLDFGLFPCSGGGPDPQIVPLTIAPNTTGTTYEWISDQYVDCGSGCPYQFELLQNYGLNLSLSNVSESSSPLAYIPSLPNTNVLYEENNYVDFSLVIDTNIKQIDILSSIAKKFNLVIIPDPDVPNQMIIEPYDYYIGSGSIYDWTDKLSWDKGFTVQPAQNFVESELILTDQEDGDEANKSFKDRNKLIYGQNIVYNPTDFKSQSKKIDTIFSPEVIRKWDERVGIPLGINYAGQSTTQTTGGTEKVIWKYSGIKSKPRLFFNGGNLSPFLDNVGESFNFGTGATATNSLVFRTSPSTGINFGGGGTDALYTLTNPVVTHTMPMGNKDINKINNDSICILFDSEEPQDIGIGIPTFNTYTDQDVYDLFYSARVNNLYDKNTRFLSGQFDLKLNDVKNLRPNDLIKIQEQYFYLNKLEGFDLTNPELTKVELIQTNNSIRPASYPTRYFKYQYCGDSTVYKFRTFFNPEENTSGEVWSGEPINSIRRTYFYWSIFYDYMVGALGGNVSGFTSSYNYVGFGSRWAYTINEINKTEYNSSGYTFWFEDDNNLLFIDRVNAAPALETNPDTPQLVWVFSNQSGYNKAFFNVATDCATFSGYCASNNVTLSPPPGSTPGSPYTTGITINVTDTGWIKYDTATETKYTYFGSLGNQDIPDCADCTTIRPAYPFADLATWTVVDCGNPC